VWAHRVALSFVHLSLSSVSPGIEQAIPKQVNIERRGDTHGRNMESVKSMPAGGGVSAHAC
jgi:hypothetical protein